MLSETLHNPLLINIHSKFIQSASCYLKGYVTLSVQYSFASLLSLKYAEDSLHSVFETKFPWAWKSGINQTVDDCKQYKVKILRMAGLCVTAVGAAPSILPCLTPAERHDVWILTCDWTLLPRGVFAPALLSGWPFRHCATHQSAVRGSPAHFVMCSFTEEIIHLLSDNAVCVIVREIVKHTRENVTDTLGTGRRCFVWVCVLLIF